MELSKRLQAVADLISEVMTVADIGTDHGYIPVYLLNTGKSPKVIAMDVKKGPLERAKEHLAMLLEQGEAQTRLSDGLKNLAPGEVECAVIAGMGGGLVIRILQESPEVTASLKECILQPQSEISKVRAFLLQEGFSIIQEDMVEEEGKYYPMMKVLPPGTFEDSLTNVWEMEELQYGKFLLENRHPVLKDFLLREKGIRERLLDDLSGHQGERLQQRSQEIQQELVLIEKSIRRYEERR